MRTTAERAQEQLSAAAGLRQLHRSRITRGDIKDVKGDTLARLARALRVSSDVLLGIDGKDTERTVTAVV